MTPILMAPGIIFGLMLLFLGGFQLRYASMIDSDHFLLSRRRVAVGMRRLTGCTYLLALAVAVAPILFHMNAQRVRRLADDELNSTIEAQRRHIEQADLQLAEANLKLEQANRQLSSINQNAAATPAAPAAASVPPAIAVPAVATPPSSTSSADPPVPVAARVAATAHIHFPNANGVYLRASPAGRIISTLKNGAALSLDTAQPQFIDGHYWTKVRTAEGLDGWVLKEAVSAEAS